MCDHTPHRLTLIIHIKTQSHAYTDMSTHLQDTHPHKGTQKQSCGQPQAFTHPRMLTHTPLPRPLPSPARKEKPHPFSRQGTGKYLTQICWFPWPRHTHELCAGTCVSLNTHTLIHAPTPNLTLLAPISAGRTKELIGEVCGEEMRRLAGSSCCHHGYRADPLLLHSAWPTQPRQGKTGSTGQGGPLPSHTVKGWPSEGVVRDRLSIKSAGSCIGRQYPDLP